MVKKLHWLENGKTRMAQLSEPWWGDWLGIKKSTFYAAQSEPAA
jgi:hypothetical protein